MLILKKGKERTAEDTRLLQESVANIIAEVQKDGDKTVRKYSEKFDKNTRADFRISRAEIDAAYDKMQDSEIEDLKQAMFNIKAFAEAQRASMTDIKDFSPQPGIFLSHRVLPIESCCCYVPGGRHPLYSSALMLITPAKVAGVKRIVASSPIDKNTGTIHYKTLVAMDLAGADEIYALGGVQAVAAFAYGTESIKPVDLIVGPGNQYLAEAKRQCYGQVGIDFVAGPSEVLVIADENANPEVTAADLLAQSEHDPNAKGILITTSESFGRAVIAAVEAEIPQLIGTGDVAKESWDTFGEVVLVDSIDEAVSMANDYAPEHLELNIANPESVMDKLYNYGSMFIGGNTAEVFGDYASGTNHTLPTVRAARYTGGVWVGTFTKTCCHQYMTREASSTIAPLVSRMADGEGLEGHSIAAKKRF